jgi:dipeptidyl aminopeptidase/acylaminoacyl peptidase
MLNSAAAVRLETLTKGLLLRACAVALLSTLFACGGGGGGGVDAPPVGTPGGTTPGTARAGQMAYYFNNDIYSVDMASGVSRIFANTLNAKPAYVAHSIQPNGGFAIAYYSDGFNSNRAPFSRLVLYKPDGAAEKSLEFDFEIISAPSFSPDGQTIALASRTRSGVLNDPAVFATNFINRDGVLQEKSLSFFSLIRWLPDGRIMFKFTDGLNITKLPLTVGAPTQVIPNTQDAGVFSVSPDGSKVAFTAKTSSVTPNHIFIVNLDGSNRRQVTDSRDQGENQVTFSPNGKELLIGTGLCSFFNFSGQYIQVVPADGNMVDVTDGTSANKLNINGKTECTNAAMSWN